MRAPTQLRASAADLEAHGRPNSVEDLEGHTLLQWIPPGLDEPDLPLLSGDTLPTAPWIRTTNMALLLDLALAGAGLIDSAWFPAVVQRPKDRFIPVLEDVVGGSVTLRALSPRSSRVDPKIRAMLENTQRLLASLASGQTPGLS